MRISKKTIRIQQKLVDRKIKDLVLFRNIQRPRSGWLKAIREALGMSARQIGERLNVTHQAVLKLEQAEKRGAATLESMDRFAKAMDCLFVYALIPKAPFQSLDDLLEDKAEVLAKKIFQQVSHSMKLEDQSVDPEDSEHHIRELKSDLKKNLDPRLWEIEKR